MTSFDYNEYLQSIEDIIANPTDEGLPDNAPVVAMFLMDYTPELPPKETQHNMTSSEIVEALEDTCQLTVSDVSAVMVKLGYRLWRDPLKGLVWSMDSQITPPLYANGLKSNI